MVFGYEFCGEVVDYGFGICRIFRCGILVVVMLLLWCGNKEVYGIGFLIMVLGVYVEWFVVE